MKILVAFDGKRFELYCDYAGNIKARNLPNREFRKTPAPHWVAKPLRANARYIDTMLRPFATITPEADQKIAELMATAELPLEHQWPTDYPWKTIPYDKQRWAVDKLFTMREWALFAEMGCGKTKIALDIAAAHMMKGTIQGVIAVGRVSIRENWVEEVAKHMPDCLNVSTFVGDSTSNRLMKELKAPKAGNFLIAVGIESLSVKEGGGKLFDALFDIAKNYDCMLVIDEAHSVKNLASARTKNSELLARMCKIRAIMTGTPTPQNMLDLYSQFGILNPDIIGIYDYYVFRNHYCVMGGYDCKEVVAFRNEEELMEKIKPFTVRFEKSDVTDLPPKVYEVRRIDMSDDLAKMYRAMRYSHEMEVLHKVGSTTIATNTVLGAYAKLRQIANGYIYDDDHNIIDLSANHPKVAELKDILDGTSEKAIIWVNTHGEVNTLMKALEKYDVVAHHGKMSPEERTAAIDSFKTNPKIRALVATIQATSVGLTLNEAGLEVFYSNPLPYTDRIQAEDRAHRIGQTKSVTVIDLVMRRTIEETILAALATKKSIMEYVLDSVREGSDIDTMLGMC